MDDTDDRFRLLLLCAARIDKASLDWSLLARQALRPVRSAGALRRQDH
jgi:hypothetical protein